MSSSLYEAVFKESLPEIIKHFDAADRKVYKQSDISRILTKQFIQWHFYLDMPVRAFTKHLCEQTIMKRVDLVFGLNKLRKETRYLWGDASVFELALSLKNHSYFSHLTAAYLHSLTQEKLKAIHVNFEQSKRFSSSVLTQEAIDLAFRNNVRVSKNTTKFKDMTIYLLNGMYTGRLGVTEKIGVKGEKLQLTGIERTLIDASVRPVYSGGVSEVINIYRAAFNKISVKRLFNLFKKLDYIYPYHQVIGFYLERAGLYADKDINMFYRIDRPFDFYLTHKMGETTYSKKWRLYYPKELD
jgi:hypothetical protein